MGSGRIARPHVARSHFVGSKPNNESSPRCGRTCSQWRHSRAPFPDPFMPFRPSFWLRPRGQFFVFSPRLSGVSLTQSAQAALARALPRAFARRSDLAERRDRVQVRPAHQRVAGDLNRLVDLADQHAALAAQEATDLRCVPTEPIGRSLSLGARQDIPQRLFNVRLRHGWQSLSKTVECHCC